MATTYALARKPCVSKHYFSTNNAKFAKSPAYVYTAVAHTEKKQIQRNLNVSYSSGKEISSKDGITTLKVDDPFAVLDDIKQTPRYWKKAKYEMFQNLTILVLFISSSH